MSTEFFCALHNRDKEITCTACQPATRFCAVCICKHNADAHSVKNVHISDEVVTSFEQLKAESIKKAESGSKSSIERKAFEEIQKLKKLQLEEALCVEELTAQYKEDIQKHMMKINQLKVLSQKIVLAFSGASEKAMDHIEAFRQKEKLIREMIAAKNYQEVAKQIASIKKLENIILNGGKYQEDTLQQVKQAREKWEAEYIIDNRNYNIKRCVERITGVSSTEINTIWQCLWDKLKDATEDKRKQMLVDLECALPRVQLKFDLSSADSSKVQMIENGRVTKSYSSTWGLIATNRLDNSQIGYVWHIKIKNKGSCNGGGIGITENIEKLTYKAEPVHANNIGKEFDGTNHKMNGSGKLENNNVYTCLLLYPIKKFIIFGPSIYSWADITASCYYPSIGACCAGEPFEIVQEPNAN